MSWSQSLSSEQARDHITILIGSAIRLLGGEMGVFVVFNEVFDPHIDVSSIVYRLPGTCRRACKPARSPIPRIP